MYVYTFRVPIESVYSKLHSSVLRPNQVQINGKGGVDQATYDATEQTYNAYISTELRKNGLPITYYTNISDVPPLLHAAQSYLIAGSIMRLFNNTENPYKDLYATGNILLRQAIDTMLLDLGLPSEFGAPEFAIDDDVNLDNYTFDVNSLL